ncbi:hypothetical protein [Leptospira inadai]|nr:hypothetical protein [Leptospira inadai]
MRSRFFSLLSQQAGIEGNGNSESGRYYVGGQVNGLSLSSVLLLQNNNVDVLQININGVFRFPATYPNQNPYSVNVLSQPIGKNCVVPNGVGSISGRDVLDILVNCSNFP